MSTTLSREELRAIYPESDGNPMAENTLQWQWIVTLVGGLQALFADRDDVFVAGDLLWYPVEGDPTIRAAPDALVVFGRPPGHRGSYLQWLEEGIAPQVVFEVLSPGNRAGEMLLKREFYERYEVEEYYVYDPFKATLEGWLRDSTGRFQPIVGVASWTSPRLGIRFDMSGAELVVWSPDGTPLVTYVESIQQRDAARRKQRRAERQQAKEQRKREEAEQLAEVAERQRQAEKRQRLEAERQKEVAEQLRMQEQQRREEFERQLRVAEQTKDEQVRAAQEAIERLAARLRALGIDPNS